jgi:hypothetical protein
MFAGTGTSKQTSFHLYKLHGVEGAYIWGIRDQFHLLPSSYESNN